MADVILYGRNGGKSTKDATATAEDIRAGLTAYIASGKVTGTLAIREASGTFTAASNTDTTVTVGFAPVSLFIQRTAAGGSDTNFQNALLKFGNTTKKCTNSMSYSALNNVNLTEEGFTVTGVTTATEWAWYAIGL